MDPFWEWNHGVQMGVFGFIIIIVLINAVASVFRTRAKQDIFREAMRSGKDVDPAIMKSLQDDDDDNSGPTAGLVLIAVGMGLAFLGYQIGKAEGDDQVFDIMLGVASIPFLIGVVLLIASLFSRKKG